MDLYSTSVRLLQNTMEIHAAIWRDMLHKEAIARQVIGYVNSKVTEVSKGLSRNELITGGGWVGLKKDED